MGLHKNILNTYMELRKNIIKNIYRPSIKNHIKTYMELP